MQSRHPRPRWPIALAFVGGLALMFAGNALFAGDTTPASSAQSTKETAKETPEDATKPSPATAVAKPTPAMPAVQKEVAPQETAPAQAPTTAEKVTPSGPG